MRLAGIALFCLVPTGIAQACASDPRLDGEVLVLEVAADRAPCVGEAVRECLLVRRPDEAEWGLFYDAIEGFEHEPGYRYRIEVERRIVPDPPADGSSYAYRLLRMVSRHRERS